MTNRRWWPIVLSAALLCISCAAHRPILYPNEHLQQVGVDSAARDIDECKSLASAYVPSAGGQRVASHTAIGSGAGAAIGAAGGATHGAAGKGAGIGAASGATAGLLHGLFKTAKPGATYRKYVDTCLADRGYRVIGWE